MVGSCRFYFSVSSLKKISETLSGHEQAGLSECVRFLSAP